MMLSAGLAPAQQPAPARPYKAIKVAPPQPHDDPELDAMRKTLADAAEKKDRTALTRLVVAQGFFWDRGSGNAADKNLSGIANLAAAIGLDKDSDGWDVLLGYAEEPSAAPTPEHKGAICAPADPDFDVKELADTLKATATDLGEWGYALADGVAVLAAPRAAAPTIDTLNRVLVRVLLEDKPVSAAYLRVITPAGKVGYADIDAIAPLGEDQLCYVKEGGAWKIGGYIGDGNEP